MPRGHVCRQLTVVPETVCATDDQLAACVDKQPLEPCALEGATLARCYDGVCVDASCGNVQVDVGEQCDDGNSQGGDGCSPDCKSNETCGNAELDLANQEVCDDGNLLDHDGCSSSCNPTARRPGPTTARRGSTRNRRRSPTNPPRCGDGTCDAVYETCQTCAMDCDCDGPCGAFLCGPAEVCPGDCP